MIETYGAEQAIARLLAFVSGHTEKLKQRSVLCGAEGYITYLIKATREFNHLGYVWGILKKCVSEKITAGIRGMKQFKSKDGAVFDVQEEQSKEFEEILFNDRFYGQNYTLEKATSTLPETMESDYRGPPTNGHSSSNGHFNSSTSNSNGNTSSNGRTTSSLGSRDQRLDIFVGNLSFDTTDNDVRSFLTKNEIGGQYEVRIALDKETGKSKGFGFVSVYDNALFEQILKCNGRKMKDRILRINNANNK